MKNRVSVIGAGVVGLLLARKLAGDGIDVVVYDQKSSLGYPVRASSILSLNGLTTLGIDYTKIPHNELRGARIWANGKSIEVRSKKPIAYSMDRHELNEMLKDECVEAGATVITGKRIEGKDLEEISKDSIIVGADGFNSVVARHYNFTGAADHVLTYRAEYITDIEDTSMVDLFFDNKIATGFFGWIAPEPNRIAEIGIGIDSKKGNSRQAYEKFLRIDNVKQFLAKARLRDEGASVIPIGLRDRFADNKKEVLLVGDAAGQVKPTTGGGIIFGGNGALIAADVIKNHIKKGTSLEEYEKLWRKKHGMDLKMHKTLKKTYSSLNSNQVASLMGFMRIFGVEKFLSEYGDMDRPSLMVKRFFLRGLAN